MKTNKRTQNIIIKFLIRTAALAAIAGAILAGVIFKGRSREDAYAAVNTTTYNASHPLVILEIAPYKGQGQWGYMVEGQEPVKVEDIKAAYPDENVRKNYWQNNFENEFYGTGLTYEQGQDKYTNQDYFINKVLTQNGQSYKTWKENGKVEVWEVSANQLTKEQINRADLIVIQSDLIANYCAYYKEGGGTFKTMLELYDTYVGKGKDKFYSKIDDPNSQLLPNKVSVSEYSNGTQIQYDCFVSYDGKSPVSMDISWENAVAILDRAFEENKATIVSAGKRDFNSVKGNMNKLIFLLTYFSKKSYSSGGHNFKQYIETAVVDGVETGIINGASVWKEGDILNFVFNSGCLRYLGNLGNSFNWMKYVWIQGTHIELTGDIKTFSDRCSSCYDMTYQDFYDTKDENGNVFLPEFLWEAAQSFEDSYGSAKGNVAEWKKAYEERRIARNESVDALGYNNLPNGMNYMYDDTLDNTIRYRYDGDLPFMPEYFSKDNNSDHQLNVFEILNGKTVSGGVTGKIKVLEIEPSTAFRYNSIHNEVGPGNRSASSDNLTELAQYFGDNWTSDNVKVDSVTPDQLNGMTVDLAAEYDAIYIGEEIGMLSDDIKDSYSSDPYHRIGEQVPSSALINGLLASDVTTPTGFTNVFHRYSPDLSNQWEKTSFLKNTALYQELNAATEGYPTARYSGNDITLYMKSQLVEFINSGQPVLLSEKVYNRTRNITSSSRTKVNLYDAFEDKGAAENVLKAEVTLNTAANYLVLKPTLKITYSDSGNILELGKKVDTLNRITRSNHLAFSYQGELAANGEYEMLVILDCNGDGIFDENVQNDTSGPTDEVPLESEDNSSQTSTQTDTGDGSDRILYKGDITEAEYQDGFDQLQVFQSNVAVDEVCQFRVIVREKTDKYLRAVWTGLMFPDIVESTAIRILQVTPDASGSDARLLKKNGSLNTQFKDILKEIDSDKQDYLITADQITVMETTEFNGLTSGKDSDNNEVNPLDSYDLIIMGFGYGQVDTDIDSSSALTCLQKYIDSGKPVIFCNNTISYVNQEKRDYYTIMKQTQPDNTEKYSIIPVAGMKEAMFPERNWWNYAFTQEMRILLGMDRYHITDREAKNTARDPVSTDTSVKEKQGFSNGLLLDPAYKDRASANIVSAYKPQQPFSTSAVQKLNEGAVHVYPFDLTNQYSNNKMSIRSGVHAPYYQLDLERSTDQDDVTVWATLGGYASSDGSYNYFDATAMDARNNYYLYSKNNIYYTAYELPLDRGNGLTEAEQNEMKFFINTIYAALRSKTKTDSVTTVPIVVAKEGAEISLYDKARVGSNPSYTPNVYTCYYDDTLSAENTDDTGTTTAGYLEIPFRVQKVGGNAGETVSLVIGLTDSTYPFESIPAIGSTALWAPLENNTVRTGFAVNGPGTEEPVADFSAFPVIRVQEVLNEDLPGSNAIPVSDDSEGSSNTAASDTLWYTLRIPGTAAKNLDGKTLLIAVRSGDTATITPEANSVYAAITFVERELFDLD